MDNPGLPSASALRIPRICTVVVPCYNEAARLPRDQFVRFLGCEKSSHIHFLFVNDGSSDRTLAVLEELCAAFPGRAGVLDQQPNRGKAEAVRRGMLQVINAGESKFTGFWDADLATPLDQIGDLLQLMLDHAEFSMVFGARVRLLGRQIARRPARHYLGRVFATVVSRLLRMPIYDTQCGAKLFRITPALSQVLAEPFQSRWIFDVELLARFLALEHGNTQVLEKQIYEYPLPVWTDVEGSKITSFDFLRAFVELLAIYRKNIA